ncbi:hypothetical protein F1C16_06015 [Hymenobacter sp. NBH84]|uniref:hypothetical protein n=1 Tax=Hymenobacter sp. NBH84 TaxID=2596915 RepID=UPI0016254FDE|nr:hypothetical protein [Hymenobacter sp. NBH84]QNE39140.1 hypothetical protein F1C16_06015 [Hymenobacter sp. NBH84]
MLLTPFLRDLVSTGAVTLTSQPSAFEADDLHAADTLLADYHAEDALELPGTVPAFAAPAARWAAQYVYHTLQLALVRELDEDVMQQYLPAYTGDVTPETIYSVDLTFRYLPDLLRLAKGLAPGDALVAQLQDIARQWPFSFVGHPEVDATAEAAVLSHPALQLAYVDRIIRQQDQQRARQPHLLPLVRAALGGHAATLWPDFHDFILFAV